MKKVNKEEEYVVTLEQRVAILEAALAEIVSHRWRARLDLYPIHRQTALAFNSKNEISRAIALFWTDLLKACPYDVLGDYIVVPSDAVPYLRAAGLEFKEDRVHQD